MTDTLDAANEQLADTLWVLTYTNPDDGRTVEIREDSLSLGEITGMEVGGNANIPALFDPRLYGRDLFALLAVVVPIRLGLDGDDVQAHVGRVAQMGYLAAFDCLSSIPRP